MRAYASRFLAAVIAFVLLPALGGCIDYERQTITYRYDSARDELRVHLLYIGIHGDDGGDSLGIEEEDQLEAAWDGGQIFLFSNWIPMVDLDELRAKAASAQDPALTDLKRTAFAAEVAASRLVVNNSRVSNGPFFIDTQDRLCAVQRVAFTHVAEILEAVNLAFRLAQLNEAGDSNGSEQDRMHSARVAAAQVPLLGIAGNRILTGNLISQREVPAAARWVERLPNGAFSLNGDMATIAFGHLDSQTEEISMTVAGRYLPNAVRFARERFGVAEKFDPVADANRFLREIHP